MYRGVSDFKKGYQPRTIIVKDEMGDLVADFHSILAACRKHFSQLLNVGEVNDVRHTAEPLVPEPSTFEVELALEKLKSYKSPGIDQNPAELIKAGGRTIRYETHKRNSIWNKEEFLRSGRSRLLYLSLRKAIKQIVVIIGAYHFCPLRTKLYPTSYCQAYRHIQRKVLGIINVDFDTPGQLLTIYSAFVKYLRKMGIQRSSASALYRLQESL